MPLKSLTLSAVTQENRMQPHEIKVASNLGITTISVDADTLESFVINPHGGGGDFIAYPVESRPAQSPYSLNSGFISRVSFAPYINEAFFVFSKSCTE